MNAFMLQLLNRYPIEETSVGARSSKRPPALRPGAYSSITLLPGEDEALFNKLHAALIADLAPAGPLEEDIVRTLARLLWRKQNLSTLDKAALAMHRYEEIWEKANCPMSSDPYERSPEEVEAASEAAEKEARAELGEAVDLVEMGERASIEHLMSELSVVDRIDSIMERCIKRLLLVREPSPCLYRHPRSVRLPENEAPRSIGSIGFLRTSPLLRGVDPVSFRRVESSPHGFSTERRRFDNVALIRQALGLFSDDGFERELTIDEPGMRCLKEGFNF